MLHSALHACNDTQSENPSRGHKIQPLVAKFVANFQKFYVLNREVASDESMIGFKGRLSFKIYNPMKPVKWGVLARTQADSRRGYLHNINLYFGKENDTAASVTDVSKTSQSLLNLVAPILGRGYHAFRDRLYNSPTLAEALLMDKTYITGTVMLNREGFSEEILKKG